MGETSRTLLRTHHRGVHAQLDVLVAAITVYQATRSELPGFPNPVDKPLKKRLVRELKSALAAEGQHSWFMLPRLAFYAFQLWEGVVMKHLGPDAREGDLSLLGRQALEECAEALDSQFEEEGRADVIACLKQAL